VKWANRWEGGHVHGREAVQRPLDPARRAQDVRGVMRSLGAWPGQVLYSSPGAPMESDERTINQKEQFERDYAN
jgi:hypothetical protein